MKKITKIILRILAIILCAVLVLSLGVFVGSKIYYHDFYKNAQRGMTIPGLNDDFIPQGFVYLEAEQVYLVSGYMKDSTEASRLYVVDEEGESRSVELMLDGQQPYTGHCGGVAVSGDNVYVSGDENSLVVFSLKDVLGGGQVLSKGKVPVEARSSFCTVANGYLLTGSFYRAESYETEDYQHVTTPTGDENTAIIWVYKINEEASLGVEDTPVAALSVREQVQGIAITEGGNIVLSTSWGLSSSILWFYEMDERVGTIGEDNVPLYYLDSENLLDSVKAPPMSEELVIRDGRVYIMTESASTKYLFGNFIDGRHVFGYEFNVD